MDIRDINFNLFIMADTEEKPIWELDTEDFLKIIYDSYHPDFLCVNKQELENWIKIIKEKLPKFPFETLNREVLKICKFPCILTVRTNTFSESKCQTYVDKRNKKTDNSEYYPRFSPSYSNDSYPYKRIMEIKIKMKNPFFILPKNKICTSLDKIEQYKHKLLNS